MVPISIRYQGDLRCRAEHGPSKTTLLTDAPVDNHGKGESFSPTDLLATALGVCMATTIGIVAQRDGIRLDGFAVDVEKHMTTTPPRKIARLVVRLVMPKGVAKERRPVLERAGHTCPVALSLHPEVKVEAEYSWPD